MISYLLAVAIVGTMMIMCASYITGTNIWNDKLFCIGIYIVVGLLFYPVMQIKYKSNDNEPENEQTNASANNESSNPKTESESNNAPTQQPNNNAVAQQSNNVVVQPVSNVIQQYNNVVAQPNNIIQSVDNQTNEINGFDPDEDDHETIGNNSQ